MNHSCHLNISVIVATCHDPAQVRQRICSMIPTAPSVELIVVEDEGRGVSWSRNRGLDQARGEWVLMIDDDDRIDPAIFNMVGTYPAADIIEWGYRIVRGDDIQNVSLVDRPTEIAPADLPRLMVENRRFTSNLWNKLIRRRAIGTLRLDEYLTHGEDWDFLWRLIASGRVGSMLIIPQLLYDYVQHPGQVSSTFTDRPITLPAAWATMLADIEQRYRYLLPEACATYASHLTVALYAAHRAHAPRRLLKQLRHALRRQLPALWRSPRHSLKKKLAATYLSL